MGEMLEDIQRLGVIKEITSLWSSPIVLIQKKNEDMGFCIDYSKLNNVTRKNCFPLHLD
jgi:hypothetical protein